MLIRARRLAALVAALALAAPALASADTTIGSTAMPTGSDAITCPAGGGDTVPLFLMASSDPATPYTVPSGAWVVNSWQINTMDAEPGATVTFTVLRPVAGSSSSYTVVGTDTETLSPAEVTAGVASFPLSSALIVQGGDTIGSYVGPDSPDVTCAFEDATPPLPADDVLGVVIAGATAPTAGQALSTFPGGPPPAETRLNLAATLTPPNYDAGVTLASGPANATVGQPAVLTATVSNAGPGDGSVTFTDPVPSALRVQFAGIDSGACTTSTANVVTCTIASLPAGQSANVQIVVTPDAAASYSDNATVSGASGATDPNTANNSAATTLNVTATTPSSISAKCVVPKLGGSSVALTKKVLSLLGCKVGKTKKAHSKSVKKGALIGTSPGAGSYALNKVIGLKVSSGPKPKPKKKHKKK